MRIGVCYSECMADKVPTHDGDIPMLLIFSEKGLFL